jgi:hypothetical protein
MYEERPFRVEMLFKVRLTTETKLQKHHRQQRCRRKKNLILIFTLTAIFAKYKMNVFSYICRKSRLHKQGRKKFILTSSATVDRYDFL